MPVVGQALVDPVTGVAGDVYHQLVVMRSAYNGLLALPQGGGPRGAVAAWAEAIAWAIVNDASGGGGVPVAGTQGGVLYDSGVVWAELAPGTAGYFLQTAGASANPTWAQALLPGNNLSELTASAATARGNLGLGTASTHATTDFDAAGAATTAQSNAEAASCLRASNLSDVVSASSARTNLGVAYGSTAGTVVQGNDVRLPPATATTNHILRWSGSAWVASPEVTYLTFPLANAGLTASSTPVVLGAVTLDPTSGLDQSLTSLTLVITAYVQRAALTGTVYLVDASTGLTVSSTTLTVTTTTPGGAAQTTSFTVPTVQTTYNLVASVTGGLGGADILSVASAQLRLVH